MNKVPYFQPSTLKNVDYVQGSFVRGEYTRRFEEACAAYLGVRYCCAVKSCTAGLQIVLAAVNGPYNPTRAFPRWACPSFTFRATAGAIFHTTFQPPDLIDCDPDTWTIRPSRRTIAVNIFGVPPRGGCRPWICDAAHGFGGSLLAGEREIRTDPTAWVFSFSPTKVMTLDGLGGLIATDDEALYDECCKLRFYGSETIEGWNAWITERPCAWGLEALKWVDIAVERRNLIAEQYREAFRDHPGIHMQKIPDGVLSTCKDFAIRVDRPAEMAEALGERGIETRRYFSPIHELRTFGDDYFWEWYSEMPVTNNLARHTLCLPIWPEMEHDHIQMVIDGVLSTLEKAAV